MKFSRPTLARIMVVALLSFVAGNSWWHRGHLAHARTAEQPLLVAPTPAKEVASRVYSKAVKEALTKASLALSEQDFAEAKRQADFIVQEEPAIAEVWVLGGMASAASQDADTARASYEKALSIYAARPEQDPRHRNDLSQRVFILTLLGRKEEARALRQAGLREYADDAGLDSMKDLVEDLGPELGSFALHPD
jgi:tetratricopeptide (TPR) repeat protein